MASEQFSLCWDNFHKNMSSGMNSLLENEDLVDVTLAVEGKYLKAHKMVLSVCSPYFKELFKTNPCKHPIVFMKDVSYVALSDLIQFMYQGEVQVSQENLTTFIKTAEALQIKGLTGDGNGSAENDVEQDDKPIEIADDFKPAAVQVPRPKKIPQPMPPIAAPAPKRQRVSAPPIPEPPATMPKVEPPSVSTPAPEVVHFKMEPYDQSQNASMQEETGDDNFGDDTLDDTAVDDTEDYSMMEGNEEEPQAGTSTEETGEGQVIKGELEKLKIKLNIEKKLEKKRIAERLRYKSIINDPVRAAIQKEKNKKKYLMKKEKGQRKLVSEMSDHEKRQVRQKWKIYSRVYKRKKMLIENQVKTEIQ